MKRILLIICILFPFLAFGEGTDTGTKVPTAMLLFNDDADPYAKMAWDSILSYYGDLQNKERFYERMLVWENDQYAPYIYRLSGLHKNMK